MSNLYYESEEVISQLESGEIPERSILSIQYPSGNRLGVRVHGFKDGKLLGCAMQWDNGITETFDLSNTVVSLVERATQRKEVI